MIPIAIKLFLGGIWKRLIEALGAVFSFARRFPWQAAVIALCALLAWQTHGKGNALDERDAAIAGRKADRLAYIDAQGVAEAKAIAVLIATETRYKDIAHAADIRASQTLADARTAAERYADSHRVRGQAACRPPGGTIAPGLPDPAPDDNGPGAAADMVAVSREDFDKLTTAAVRAAVNHEWGEALIRDGLALPTPAF